MKLHKILENLNSFEKNSFLKIVGDIISNEPKNQKAIESLLADAPKDLKAADNKNISEVFKLVQNEFEDVVRAEFKNSTSQFDILIDIIIRDGNCIMKQDWFSRLYDAEINHIEKKKKELAAALKSDKSDIEPERKKDYEVYQACLKTAYTNDDLNNHERKVTSDEQSILNTLSKKLGLSQEEIKLINYLIVPIEKKPVDDLINDLKNIGVIFYSKKQSTIYVADEVIRVLRRIRGKDVADKYFRRVLRSLREPQINVICKKHGIDRKQSFEEKIKEIINEGVDFSDTLSEDLYKPETTLTEKKKFLNELAEKALGLENLKGSTVEDKIDFLIKYFESVENDDKIGISMDGYDTMVKDIAEIIPNSSDLIKQEFELQDEKVMVAETLLDYNIKPRDILEILPNSSIEALCKARDISTRGKEILNILEAYKDSENLLLENYENLAFRDFGALKDNGIRIKEAEIGNKFEELTKDIFQQLGFHVNETLRKKLNTSKDKIDILVSLDNNEVILIECKTNKESGYNKFSSVSRQLKSYAKLLEKNDYSVAKSLLIAPEFTDDFVGDCELEYDLNLSLISAKTLLSILEGLKSSKHSTLPPKLLYRDVLIQENRVLKALSK